MEFGISTRSFGTRRLTVDLLERLRRAEFTRIELFANRPAFDYLDRALLRSIASWFQENASVAASIHLPFKEDLAEGKERPISLLDPERRIRVDAMDEMKRCLELAERIHLEYAVLHLGGPNENFNPAKFDFAYAAVAGIQAFSGVPVLVENLPSEFATIDRLLEFKAVSDLPDLGLCYDIGHERLVTSNSEQRKITDVVKAIHLDDNAGTEDEHLTPFDGTINWPSFIEDLAISKVRAPLIFELSHAKAEKVRDCRRRLEDLLNDAENSIEEFRLRYKLNTDDANLH